MELRPKKVALFPEIELVKSFYHLPACIVECYQNMYFNYKKKQPKKKKKKEKRRRQKAKETKEEKRISVENLTGYDDIVCEFALCTFNLLLLVSFSWLVT